MKRARVNRPVMADLVPYRVRRRCIDAFLAWRSHCDPLAIGSHPAPGTGAVAALDHTLLVDLGNDLAVAGEQRFGRAHLRAQRQLALQHAIGAVLGVFFAAARNFRPAAAGAIGALVHLAAGPKVADFGILRRAEGTRVETVAAADAQILRMKDDTFVGRENAGHRADRRAGSVGTVHAGHGDRALAGLAVIDGDDAPAIDAPRHFVFVLASGDAGVALDAAVGVAEKLHPSHRIASSRRSDLTERGFRLLHARHRIESVGAERVHALAKHDRIATFRIPAALIDALEPAGEVKRHPGHALADAFRHEGLHPCFGVVFGAGDPDPATILDAACGCIRRVDLHVHVLLQLGQPLVGSRLLAAALVLDQAARAENEREPLYDAVIDRGLLHAEADIGHAELLRIRPRRVLADEIGPRRVDRFAVDGDGVRQIPGDRARLAVAVRYAAVVDRHALDAAGEVDRPGHGVGVGGVHLLDDRHFLRGEILVPAELLQHPERELGIAVLDVRVLRV